MGYWPLFTSHPSSKETRSGHQERHHCLEWVSDLGSSLGQGTQMFSIPPTLPGHPAVAILPNISSLFLSHPACIHKPPPSMWLPSLCDHITSPSSAWLGAGTESDDSGGHLNHGSSFVSIDCLQQARQALYLRETQAARRSDPGTRRDIIGVLRSSIWTVIYVWVLRSSSSTGRSLLLHWRDTLRDSVTPKTGLRHQVSAGSIWKSRWEGTNARLPPTTWKATWHHQNPGIPK